MLINIPKTPIDHHALRAHILGPRAHQPAPASGIQTLWLRHEDNAVSFNAVCEMLGGFGRARVGCIDHLNRVGWAKDFGLACLLERGEHFQAV